MTISAHANASALVFVSLIIATSELTGARPSFSFSNAVAPFHDIRAYFRPITLA